MALVRILVVEDDMVISMHIRGMLTSTGYSVCGKASSGREAIDKAGDMRPDLVLMDVILQESMDGIAAAQYIHSSYNIPIVFLSGCADSETLERARAMGHFAYLTKPFTDRELDSAIKMTLNRYGVEGQRKDLEKAGTP
jgi:CheY-like chemotaxis protein